MQKEQLKTNVTAAETAMDNTVSGNASSISSVSPKTAYSKNITLEEWNQVVANVSADLQNASKDRDLATALAAAVVGLLDNYVEWTLGVSASDYLTGSVTEVSDDTGIHKTFTLTFDDGAIDHIIDGTTPVAKAVSATNDKDGTDLTTYAKSLSHGLSGGESSWTFTISLRDKYNRVLNTETQVFGAASNAAAGLMSKADKIALDAVPTVYETKSDAAAKVARSNLVSILGEASSLLNGLMSATDKSRLDALYALLGSEADSDTVVNTINEVLAIFNSYPESVTLVNALALKVSFSDVINNLSSNEISKPLSAYQGKVLNGRLATVEEDYVTHDDAFASGMISVSDIDSVPDDLTFDSDGNVTNDNWTGEMEIEYISTAVSSITSSDIPSTLTFDLTQDYYHMITNADWTGKLTFTY